MAIMFPAMMPPPMPVKIFEFAAGVFEMRPALFATAIFTGKFVQFMVCALVTILFGPKIVNTAQMMVRLHFDIVLGVISGLGLAIVLYLLRKYMGRRNSTSSDDTTSFNDSAENIDSTLIT